MRSWSSRQVVQTHANGKHQFITTGRCIAWRSNPGGCEGLPVDLGAKWRILKAANTHFWRRICYWRWVHHTFVGLTMVRTPRRVKCQDQYPAVFDKKGGKRRRGKRNKEAIYWQPYQLRKVLSEWISHPLTSSGMNGLVEWSTMPGGGSQTRRVND